MAKRNLIREQSFEYVVDVVKIMSNIISEKKEYIMTKQLIKIAATAGANIEHAAKSRSTRDFIYKLSLSKKELKDAAYWLRLMMATDYLDKEIGLNLMTKGNELKSQIINILDTSKTQLEN